MAWVSNLFATTVTFIEEVMHNINLHKQPLDEYCFLDNIEMVI